MNVANKNLTVVGLQEYLSRCRAFALLRPAYRYTRKEPALINLSETNRLIQRGYKKYEAEAPAEGVVVFSNATVTKDGVIVTDDDYVIQESIESHKDPCYCAGSYQLDDCVEEEVDEAVMLTKVGARNYGHFIVEILPRLLLNEESLPIKAPIMISEKARALCQSILGDIGGYSDRLLYTSKNPIKVNRLVWPVRNTIHPLANSPAIFDAFSMIKKKWMLTGGGEAATVCIP